MIQFLLNDKLISSNVSPGLPLLDLIRYEYSLKGTKIGCREGDCGACTILCGTLKNGTMEYISMTSCLMAAGNAAGKHIVTIEGLNLDSLNLIQQAFADNGATQCGFCTPGFIVSLAGFCLDPLPPSFEKAIDSVNGNICRCTGYKSIERAIKQVADVLHKRGDTDAVSFAVTHKILPAYFSEVKTRLTSLQTPQPERSAGTYKNLGGGTDLYVQQHETMPHTDIRFLNHDKDLSYLHIKDGRCFIGGTATVTDLAESTFFPAYFPGFAEYIKLISSTQIRNMATIAGNFTNASPIGDFSIFFLALDASLLLEGDGNRRTVFLRDFFKGYKLIDKLPGEIMKEISFQLPGDDQLFNFEKVSKRTWLDIASVNSAISLKMESGHITEAGLSAGGVGPVPMFLKRASGFLIGKHVSEELVAELCSVVISEISPISDARGTAAYKRLLLTQLIKAHFIKLFPSLNGKKLLSATCKI